MKTLPLLLVSLVALTCASCQLLYKSHRPEWVEAEVECVSTKAMFEVTALALIKSGFPVGGGADPANSKLLTGWHTSASPFKGRGYRDRAHVKFEDLRQGWFQVRVRVERETNESFRPLDQKYAKWKGAADNPEGARRVIEYIHALLRSTNPVSH